MHKSKLINCLFVASLIGCVAGCSKSDNTAPAPPSPAAEKPASPEPKPAASALQQFSPPATAIPTNASAPVAKVAADTTTRVTSAAASPAPENNSPPPATSPAPTTLTPPTLASLSEDQVVRGLQEALGKGLQQAVVRLGHDDGFLTNLNVKIPMPEKLQKIESALRTMKQDKLADDFVATMNHAAEQAVPEAGAVFADALKQMTIADAKSILTGPSDAATQYFQHTTQTNLYARFYPIVQQATQKTGVTAAYKKVIDTANVADASQLTEKLGSLGSVINTALPDKQSIDLDGYVTNKAMEGLFKMVDRRRKANSSESVARTTDLLQQVFGALKK